MGYLKFSLKLKKVLKNNSETLLFFNGIIFSVSIHYYFFFIKDHFSNSKDALAFVRLMKRIPEMKAIFYSNKMLQLLR